jgi:hypothetical protein
MADPIFVDRVVEALRRQWDPTNYPGTYAGDVPAIIARDDTTSHSYEGRRVAYDLTDNNAVVVDATPTRQQTPIGTEFDYRYEDGVGIEVVGVHTDQYGHLAGSDEFRALYQEVRRVLHADRVFPFGDEPDDQATVQLTVDDETNLSSRYQDLYAYDLTASLRGFEELP